MSNSSDSSAWRYLVAVGLDTEDLFDMLSDDGVRVFWALPQGEQDRVMRWWRKQKRRKKIAELLHLIHYHPKGNGHE